jgi:hypothetical protein
VRGGSWRYGAENARAAGRSYDDDANYDPTGFRLARSAP